MKKLLAAIAVVLLANPVLAHAAQEFTCRVAAVLDGDTISCIGHDEKIRLVDIDAPETAKPGKKGQPYGDDARRSLESMIARKDVRVVWSKKDRYGRKLGTIYVGQTDVNAEMVRGGHAWVYDEYASGEREEFLELLENQARNAKLGIWSLPVNQQVEPWNFRAGKAAANDNDDQSVVPLGPPECGTKKTCSQMTSCAEATAFFTQCKGLAGLDGNKDGKPCDALCGQ